MKWKDEVTLTSRGMKSSIQYIWERYADDHIYIRTYWFCTSGVRFYDDWDKFKIDNVDITLKAKISEGKDSI